MTSSGAGSIRRMTQNNVPVACCLTFQLKTNTPFTEPTDYFQGGGKFLRLLTQQVVNQGCTNSLWQTATAARSRAARGKITVLRYTLLLK